MSVPRVGGAGQGVRVRDLPGMCAGPNGRVFLTFCLVLAFVALAVASCGRSERSSNTQLSPRVVPLGQPVPKGGGHYKVGNAYQINGRWYHPREDTRYDRVGTASWYGELFHGRQTSNGEIYDMNALTAAHPTLPMPTYARVTNLANGRSLVVRINDRGPYAHNRIIDMSARSAELLGFRRNGTAPVRVTYLGRAPLNGDDSYERRYLASQSWTRYAGAPTRRRMASVAADPMTVGSLPDPDPAPAQPRPQPAAAMTPAPPASQGGDRLYLQAASFRDRDNATRLRQRLATLGPAEVLTAQVGAETYFRVRLGPFASHSEAEAARREAAAAGAPDARITAH